MSMAIAERDRTLVGVGWMLVTTFLFVCVTGIVRYLGSELPAVEAAFIRYAFGTVFMMPALVALVRRPLAPTRLGLHATRGFVRGPDAIVDTRSLAPGVPQRYVHELDIPDAAGPLRVEVTLRFRSFPPYLIRAFIEYEREQQRLGRRAGGPLVDARALERLDIVDVAEATLEIP